MHRDLFRARVRTCRRVLARTAETIVAVAYGCAAGVAVSSTPPSAVVLMVVGAVAGGAGVCWLATGSTMRSPRPGARSRARAYATFASVATVLVLGLLGGGRVAGAPGVVVLLALLLLLPAVIRLVRWWVFPPQAPAPGVRPVVERLSAEQLSTLWRTSFFDVRTAVSPAALAGARQTRVACLDELERRDPVAFESWLLRASAYADPGEHLDLRTRPAAS